MKTNFIPKLHSQIICSQIIQWTLNYTMMWNPSNPKSYIDDPIKVKPTFVPSFTIVVRSFVSNLCSFLRLKSFCSVRFVRFIRNPPLCRALVFVPDGEETRQRGSKVLCQVCVKTCVHTLKYRLNMCWENEITCYIIQSKSMA
jgi:hypothetical protein